LSNPFLALTFAFAACSGLLHISIPQLYVHFLDQPIARSSHLRPTPSGGGFAFVLVSFIASVLGLFSVGSSALLAVPLFALPLAFVGFLDDRLNLPPRWRYGFQLATALVLIFESPLVAPSLAALPSLVLLTIAFTAVINFTNFMDGLDGLVAGCFSVALTAVAIQFAAPWPIWSLVGALLGFLFWNWSPAQVFMGDVGSTFLGAVFAGLVLQAPSWAEALALLLVATPLLGDACLCVPRRLLAGQRIFQAHRLHLFQRLYQAGWPHARVSSLYIGATAALALALLSGSIFLEITLAALELLIGLWLDQRVAVPFSVASHS